LIESLIDPSSFPDYPTGKISGFLPSFGKSSFEFGNVNACVEI
jgi:hypothetical protein